MVSLMMIVTRGIRIRGDRTDGMPVLKDVLTPLLSPSPTEPKLFTSCAVCTSSLETQSFRALFAVNDRTRGAGVTGDVDGLSGFDTGNFRAALDQIKSIVAPIYHGFRSAR